MCGIAVYECYINSALQDPERSYRVNPALSAGVQSRDTRARPEIRKPKGAGATGMCSIFLANRPC